jgi:hypothetical protein
MGKVGSKQKRKLEKPETSSSRHSDVKSKIIIVNIISIKLQ